MSTALDPLTLSGPILKIFGMRIKDNDMTIDDEKTFVQFNLFGPHFYSIETNLVSSHVNNVVSDTLSTSNLLRVIPLNNAKPGITSSFERMNDGGCLEVTDPTIDLITLTFKDQDGDYLLNLTMFVVTFVLDYVVLPKEQKEEFFSLDKIRRATADKVREQAVKRLRTGRELQNYRGCRRTE